MTLPRPARRWLSASQHHRVYEQGTDAEKIRYLGVLRLDPRGPVGCIGAEVLQDYMSHHALGPLALDVLNTWAKEETGDRSSSREYYASTRDDHEPPLTNVHPGPNAPGIGTDSGRMIRRAITVLADSTPHNWRRFTEGLDEVRPFVGLNALGTLLTRLDDDGVVLHDNGPGVRPAFRLACQMASPKDLCTIRSRRIDPKVAGRAMFYSTWLADALNHPGISGGSNS